MNKGAHHMARNIGSADTLIRLALGAALLAAPYLLTFSNPVVSTGMVVVGTILMVTAVFSFCPLYALLGIRTCGLPK
jgi:hypothetical protein